MPPTAATTHPNRFAPGHDAPAHAFAHCVERQGGAEKKQRHHSRKQAERERVAFGAEQPRGQSRQLKEDH